MSNRVWLDVRSDESKELLAVTGGAARYDEHARSWYVDSATAVRFGQSLERWFRPVISIKPDDKLLPMTIFGIDYECYQCKKSSLAVVWWEVPGDDISATARYPLQLAAEALWSVETERVNRRGEWAHFKDRFSKTQGETYFSNGCRFDDALFGEVRLSQRHEALRTKPGAVVTLGIIPVPSRLVEKVFAWYDAQ